VAEGLTTFLKRSLASIVQIVVYSVLVFALFSYLFKTHFSWDQMKAFAIGGSYIATCAILVLWITPQLIRHLLVRHQRAYAHQLIAHILTSASGMSFVVLGLGMTAFVSVVLLWGVESLIGFGLGMVFAAFFLRIGGGLYKTTSDIAATSLEATSSPVPTFDRRNPVTLLEIAGDLIGGVMGFSTDIITSFFFSLIACVLFSSSFLAAGYVDTENALKLFVFPIVIATVALVVALVTWAFSRIRLRFRSQNILLESIYLAIVLVGGSTYLFARYLRIELNTAAVWGSSMGFHPILAYLTGLIGGALIGFTAEVLTSRRYKTSQRIAAHTEFGTAVTVINGFSSGLVSNGFYSFYMIGIAGLSFTFGGIYGIALAALGMLSTTPTLLAATLFTPIASNSLKIATLTDPDSPLESNARKADQLGQTTAPIGNGFASGAATLSTFALFFSLIMSTRADLERLFLMDPMLLFGILIGLALSLVFCGLLFRGLGKTVVTLIRETLRQFRDIPYLLEDKARPDVIKASTVLAAASIAALTWPALIMGLIPLVVGYALGIKWLCGV
ncbi:MAG: sodium/proton-translocating pyrophosphatase, partial [Candidatus Margulisiibacteriota bacterium]